MAIKYFLLDSLTPIRRIQEPNRSDIQRFDRKSLVWVSDTVALARYFYFGEIGIEPISAAEANKMTDQIRSNRENFGLES